jgi:hypothetical protein
VPLREEITTILPACAAFSENWTTYQIQSAEIKLYDQYILFTYILIELALIDTDHIEASPLVSEFTQQLHGSRFFLQTANQVQRGQKTAKSFVENSPWLHFEIRGMRDSGI